MAGGTYWTLAGYAYLVVAFGYALYAGGQVKLGWEAMLLPLVIGEYVLALATGLALQAQERAGDQASAQSVARKGVAGILVLLAPFIWYVLSALWRVAPVMALGYVVALLGRAWDFAHAGAVERRRAKARIGPPIYTFLIGAALLALLGVKDGAVAGALYFAVLAVVEVVILKKYPATPSSAPSAP